ncbi:MAG TPA: DUF4124 domain-containing protein [Pseudomonadales bacterium]|nr:DUF4124 domain-containing protein [Pseudomonadales bacterium]
MTILLLFLGLLLIIVGGLMLLIATFRVGIWWGLFCLIFAPLQIVFVFKHWHESRASVFTQTVGFVLILIALLVGGDSFMEQYKTQFNQRMQQIAPEQMQQWNELQSMMAGSDFTVNTPVSATVETGNNADASVAPAAVVNQKVIHKCVDAKGRVAYTEQPCTGVQEKTIAIKNIEEPPGNNIGGVLDAVKKIAQPDSEPAR